jgi:transposase
VGGEIDDQTCGKSVMWNDRGVSARRGYPSDLTGRQWELIEPLLPEPPAGPAGRPPGHSKREVVNAILYLTRAGCSWRMLPKDFPPWQTVYRYFCAWRKDGTLDQLHDALREQVRVKEERRNPEPSAGIVDSQSVKGADTVSAETRGYDAGKKINGRKRHIVVDTMSDRPKPTKRSSSGRSSASCSTASHHHQAPSPGPTRKSQSDDFETPS